MTRPKPTGRRSAALPCPLFVIRTFRSAGLSGRARAAAFAFGPSRSAVPVHADVVDAVCLREGRGRVGILRPEAADREVEQEIERRAVEHPLATRRNGGGRLRAINFSV